MKKYFKKIIGLLAGSLLFPIYAFALDQYTLLAPLPTIGNTTDFPTWLPKAFNLSVGIAAGLAFVMISLGGIMYATTDAIGTKSEGRKYIENAIYGLLLVIGAYVILYTINPKILEFSFVVPQPPTATSTASAAPGSCVNCALLSSENIPAQGSAIGKSVSVNFMPKLIQLKANAEKSGIGWYVSEAAPVSSGHRSACHTSGNCVDANVSSPTAANINKFYDISRSSGLIAVYEVKTELEKQDLIKSGVRAAIISVNTDPTFTGRHFHVR